MRDRCELAWAAGFFDGEGNIRAKENTAGGYQLRLTVTQAHEPALRRFERAVGIKGSMENRGRSVNGTVDVHNLGYYKFESVQAIIAMLWTFLCDQKREQATEALMKARTKVPLEQRRYSLDKVREYRQSHAKNKRLLKQQAEEYLNQ